MTVTNLLLCIAMALRHDIYSQGCPNSMRRQYLLQLGSNYMYICTCTYCCGHPLYLGSPFPNHLPPAQTSPTFCEMKAKITNIYTLPTHLLCNGFVFIADMGPTKDLGLRFHGLISDFLSSHPGYHVNPRRVNGSGVETLFGQLNHWRKSNRP